MKITIEPTDKPDGDATRVHHKVSLEHPYDHLDMDEIIPLIRGALVAYGFHLDTVNEYIPEEV